MASRNLKMGLIAPSESINIAYPFYKWKKEVKDLGIAFQFGSSLSSSVSNSQDVLIVTSRFFRRLLSDYFQESGRSKVRNILLDLRKRNKYVIFYDVADSTGSRDLDFIDDVDLLLKKQVHSDLSRYLQKAMVRGYRIWLDEDQSGFKGCSESQLNKITPGWNIGYSNFRSLNISNNLLFGYFLTDPKFAPPSEKRTYTVTYRGTVSGSRFGQRNGVMEVIRSMNGNQFITGDVLNRAAYLKEMRDSRAVVSPFGFGEICYRDFEAFICGCVLIKPDMSHLDTFPNWYNPYETYVPVKWDLSDLEEVIIDVDKNYCDYMNIARSGQNLFREHLGSFDLFYGQLLKILHKVSNGSIDLSSPSSYKVK